jgi:hypothetical protein
MAAIGALFDYGVGLATAKNGGLDFRHLLRSAFGVLPPPRTPLYV